MIFKKYTTALTIAGSDSSGGAGIQADIKTLSALGVYAASVITGITAQNTCGVQAVHLLPETIVAAQLESIFTDIEIHAIKIGMLGNASIMRQIANIIKKYQLKNIVLDPVMIAKSGDWLQDKASLTTLMQDLLPLANLITPNLVEAEYLLGIKIANKTQMEQAAKTLSDKYNVAVLLKGGHLSIPEAADVLCLPHKNNFHWFVSERIPSTQTHGTGCTLSSAIAANLAKKIPLIEAIQHAKDYLNKSLLAGKEYQLGAGCGPLKHFYFLE